MRFWVFLVHPTVVSVLLFALVETCFVSCMRVFFFTIILIRQWWANIIKWTQTNIQIYLDATLCTKRISKYIGMHHIYWTNIRIYSYFGYSTNTNTNNIQGSFYSNIQTFILITDWRNFLKGPLMLPVNKISHWIFLMQKLYRDLLFVIKNT